ncbi:MAG: P-II family nitrogen regulator [archaeon]
MKKIEAILRYERFNKVKDSLAKAGFIGMTTYEVKGRGRQKGLILSYKGHEYREDLLPKVKIELVTKDEDVDKAIEVIQAEARSGEIGDGKIFITNIEDVIRIRTGERGPEAI